MSGGTHSEGAEPVTSAGSGAKGLRGCLGGGTLHVLALWGRREVEVGVAGRGARFRLAEGTGAADVATLDRGERQACKQDGRTDRKEDDQGGTHVCDCLTTRRRCRHATGA